MSAARVYLAFLLIGLSATFLQSTALTAAQIIAAAIGIFPAGLGLREALAGVIGSFVHVRSQRIGRRHSVRPDHWPVLAGPDRPGHPGA